MKEQGYEALFALLVLFVTTTTHVEGGSPLSYEENWQREKECGKVLRSKQFGGEWVHTASPWIASVASNIHSTGIFVSRRHVLTDFAAMFLPDAPLRYAFDNATFDTSTCTDGAAPLRIDAVKGTYTYVAPCSKNEICSGRAYFPDHVTLLGNCNDADSTSGMILIEYNEELSDQDVIPACVPDEKIYDVGDSIVNSFVDYYDKPVWPKSAEMTIVECESKSSGDEFFCTGGGVACKDYPAQPFTKEVEGRTYAIGLAPKHDCNLPNDTTTELAVHPYAEKLCKLAGICKVEETTTTTTTTTTEPPTTTISTTTTSTTPKPTTPKKKKTTPKLKTTTVSQKPREPEGKEQEEGALESGSRATASLGVVVVFVYALFGID